MTGSSELIDKRQTAGAPRLRRSPLSRWLPVWRRMRIDGLVERADRARDSGDFAAAATLYRRALRHAPRDAAIRVQLAHMLKELTLFGEAEAAYRQALALQPDDGDVHLQLGHLLKMLGRREEAIAAYSAANRLLPGGANAAAELRALAPPQGDGNVPVPAAPGRIEALLAMTGELVDKVGRLTAALPDFYDQLAFPLDAYDRFRLLFDVPPPQLSDGRSFAVVAIASGLALDCLYAQLAALGVQSHQNWQLAVVGSDPAQRRAVERRGERSAHRVDRGGTG